MSIDSLTKITGLYVLAADGRIGFVGPNKTIERDDEATQALGPHIARFLAHCDAEPAGLQRVAIIYRAPQRKPWGEETLVLDARVVRELYPITGQQTEELTVFQKKSQENSVYRGIELLLEYHRESMPEVPIYCPLLYDRQTVLAQYPTFLNRPLQPADENIPVVEVVNLLATIPVARRDVPEVQSLLKKAHERLIHKGMRRSGEFTLVDKVRPGARVEVSPDAMYFDADKRSEPKPRAPAAAPAAAPRAGIDLAKLKALPRFEQLEKWADRNRRSVDAETLRTFTPFRDHDMGTLAAVAQYIRVYSVPSGTRLLDRGMNDEWNLFLIEGTVSLAAADGANLVIVGGSEKAANPIASLKPRKYAVTAMTTVSFLWIPNMLLEAIAAAPALPSLGGSGRGRP